MSTDGKQHPPPDLRFDTSDTAAAPSARVAATPVAVLAAAAADRSRPLVVKIPPKDMPRGSEPAMEELELEPDADGDSEALAPSFASGSVMSAAPPVPAPLVTQASKNADDAVAAKRGIERIKMPRVSKRYDAVPSPAPSRKLVIGAAAVAGTCLAIAAGAVLWARSSVSKSEAVAAPRPPSAAVADDRAAVANDRAAVANDRAAVAPDGVGAGSTAVGTTDTAVGAPDVAVVAPDVAVVAPDVAVGTPDVAVVAPDVAVVAPKVVASGAGSPSCSLDIRASVAGATVWVDGKRIGPAPATYGGACSAVANVEVRHPRYATFTEAVALDPTAAGGVTSRVAQMEREKTTLTLTSEPAGAQVTYNGSVVGKTPLVVKVPRYEQGVVWFKAPNHEPDWRKIIPNKATKTLSIKLKGMILRPPSS